MLYFYQSNQLDVLAGLIGPLMAQNRLSNPLMREQVLVQSPGMAQWLKLELARQLRVSANIDFPLPASFIWQMFHVVLDDVPEQSPFNKQAMAWRLMRILPEQRDDASFAPLFQYLTDNVENQARKLWQLCEKIADLFDQYLVYRPNWMSSWEAGDDLELISKTQPWQPKLWRLLVDDTVAKMDSPYHRGNLFSDFIERLTLGTPVSGLPERVFIFGISALPPAYLKALQALAHHIDIHLFFGNPSREYWGDVRDELALAGNPLLASMGKLGSDYLELLAETDKQELDLELFIEPVGETILATLQRDILHLENPIDPMAWQDSQHKRLAKFEDNSVRFMSCHSARRELEVLHDSLLAMFEADPELTPRDVIVMAADINAYSSAIEAVFGSVDEAHYIPYAISDRSARDESPLLQSFIELLALPTSRSSASGLLTLLEVPAIGRRFGIAPEKLPQLRQWVIESGVRWGLDKTDMQRWSNPDDSEQNSWLFGLKRMLLGYAMASDTLVKDVLPYPESQGLSAELVGLLADFIDALITLRNALLENADYQLWQQRLLWIVDTFYEFDEPELFDQQRLQQLIEQLYESAESCDYRADIDAMIIHDYARAQLSNASGSQRFLAGPINFCTLLPMRAIPFKVVCLLGMNDADYPRNVPNVGFDLMAENPMQRGDRSRREDDRYLFLEALLAAQQQLYISYVGRSVNDNSPLEPSVLVSELRDYLGQSFALESDLPLDSDQSAERLLAHLTLEHPLQPFSPEYFRPGENYFSYHPRWLSAARALDGQFDKSHPVIEQKLTQPMPLDEPLSYQDLQQFVRAPSEWLYKRRLNIYYPNLEEQLVEAESFNLSGLARYQLDEQLLGARLQDSAFDEVSQRLKASGHLPHGEFGSLSVEKRWQSLDPLVGRLAQLPALSPSRWAVRLEPLSVELPAIHGWLTSQSAEALVGFRPGKLRAQDKLLAWLDYLMACLSDAIPTDNYLLGIDEAISFSPIEPSVAAEYLSQWLIALKIAWQEPFLFPTQALWLYVEHAWDDTRASLSEDSAVLSDALNRALTHYQGEFGEVNNRYIYQWLGDDFSQSWQELEPWVIKLLVPMKRYVTEFDDE
ncbi:exodeoxyribonuclease V subunit gamma [Celerinatantimonas sp. MCCC 1A17872]|uniref:exodeoxyribonuclease V subunit gamma n=1 Tax=Celerinatantimonas sp. MCCC 1A17872 TaxID=3177514 RepID=UPI0038C64F6D